MAELIADDEDLVVRLTPGEKIWGFHGDVRVRLSSIVSVASDSKPWLGLRGWRMAGVSFVGHAVLGTRRHGDGYDFCALHREVHPICGQKFPEFSSQIDGSTTVS